MATIRYDDVGVEHEESKGVTMNLSSKITIGEITDPVELADARAQRAQFDRNSDWLQEHASEIYPRHRGQHICIAGEEVFAADTAQEAWTMARAAHPDDRGAFLHYIPKEKVPRIYAH